MKTLALIIMLTLHTTGLWQHLPAHARQQLVADATATPTISVLSATTIGTLSDALPVQTGAEAANITATGAYAVDTATGTVLYAKNATAHRPVASITKLVTALVILSRHQPTDIVTIPKLPTYQPEDELIGLVPGETYQVGQLLRALLIQSANDAADAFAGWDAGSTAKFAAEMNAKMTSWGIADAHFTNPSGLQDAGNYTSAEALSKIAGLALANPLIRQTVGQSEATITSTTGRLIPVTTTNDLLASGKFYGIKTGYTLAAGECFVGLTRIQGHEVITVVLGADDRFAATQALTNWISRNYQWL